VTATSTALPFSTEKTPVRGNNGVIVANHPLGAAAGAEVLAGGGNAVDAAVTTLLTLTVVEPMMVGLIGGGMMHIRDAAGAHVAIDGQSQAPAAATADMFEAVSDDIATRLDTVGRRNAIGPSATATAGNLRAWAHALETRGTISLGDALAPAIRHAERGFLATPYLAECVAQCAADIALEPAMAQLFLPDGKPLCPGQRLIQSQYAQTLKTIASQGVDALHGGSVGQTVADYIASRGGSLALGDLADYAIIERQVVRASYGGFEIVGPPPPASGGIHVIQMLNLLEGYDMAGMGYGSGDATHLLAEVMKIAFADRDAATGDPAFINVPVERLIDKAYATERRAQIDMMKAQAWSPGVSATGEGAHTTHMTVVDRHGGIVAATHTINSLFGARYMVGDTGMIANNYMYLFDPHPGRALSIAPGKRVPTSMAPVMGLKDGEAQFALGLTGGVRIFTSAMQAVVNLISHGMSLQEAVEAPRVWTQGGVLELETGVPDATANILRERGHSIVATKHLGGGMNGVSRQQDGSWLGAACWRADGTAMAVGGGNAREGVRFFPEVGV
jgi:gamma-glutamyltranspeptidase/glutathione hydrolase